MLRVWKRYNKAGSLRDHYKLKHKRGASNLSSDMVRKSIFVCPDPCNTKVTWNRVNLSCHAYNKHNMNSQIFRERIMEKVINQSKSEMKPTLDNCKLCKQTFKDKSDMVTHYLLQHGVQEENIVKVDNAHIDVSILQ